MAGVDATQRYSVDDLNKWAGYEGSSTVRVMNQIRSDVPSVGRAPALKNYVEFGADDVTATATKHEQEALSTENLSAHGGPIVLHLVAEGIVEGAAAGAGLIAAAVVLEIIATGKEIIAGDAITAAAERDTMQAAMLANLDLPQGYKDQEMTKIMSKYTDGWQGGAQRIAEQGRLEPSKMALVQIHADQGCNAARDMLAGGVDKNAYFAHNPGAAARYVTDPAFKRGFDAMAWAHAAGPAQYGAAVDGLKARDAMYVQAHVRMSV